MNKPLFYVGLDVHQNMTAYAVRNNAGEIVNSGECATRFEDIHKALEPQLFSVRIGLESCTSYYHVYQSFKKQGYDIQVANTLRMRQLVAKSDRLDAERLSDMLRLGSFPTSYVPDEKIMKLRTMINLRHSFVEESTRFKNQIQSALMKYGFKISERTSFSKRWCEQLRKLMALHPELIELRYAFEHYGIIDYKLEALSEEIIAYCNVHWKKQMELLDSIPGIASTLAAYFIAEIHPITRFASKKKLRRYAGVIPCSRESGGRVYGSSLPKTSSRTKLRWALVQASWASVRGKNRLAAYFNKKRKTRKKNRAIVAVASSLCDIVYNVLMTQKSYS